MSEFVELVKWPDLSRFGAHLRVIPASPLRDNSEVLCLDVSESSVFLRQFKPQTPRENVGDVLKGFGFSEEPFSVVEAQEEVDRYTSTKSNILLSELRQIFPSFSMDDLCDVPKKDVYIESYGDIESAPELKKQINVLTTDNVGVWTPKVNPFDKPNSEAASIGSLVGCDFGWMDEHSFMVFSGGIVSGFNLYLAHGANYRENALIPYYADLEDAEADGWKREELKQVDLPYALPLWVNDKGKIFALKDIRHVPEIWAHDEPSFVHSEKRVVAAIREAKEIRPIVAAAVQKWKEWGGDVDTVENSTDLVESVNSVVSLDYKLHEKHTEITPSVYLYMNYQIQVLFGDKISLSTIDFSKQNIATMAGNYLQLSKHEVEELTTQLDVAISRSEALIAKENDNALGRDVDDGFGL